MSSVTATSLVNETNHAEPNKTERKLRYGLIGTGMMGQEHIRNIALLPNAEVVAIADPDEQMRTLANAWIPDASAYTSMQEMLEQQSTDRLDALVVVSPNFQHAKQLQQIIEQCDLPVLIEKPICTTPEQVAELKSLAENASNIIWVAMEYRYMPPIHALIEQMRDNSTNGDFKMMTVKEHRFPFLSKVGDWNRFNRYTGGTLVEKCCHFFDLMRHAMQSEPTRIVATGSMAVNHKDETYEDGTPDIIDSAYVIVDFENGKHAMLELSMFAEGSRYQEEISVVTDQVKLEALVPGPGRFWDTASLGPAPIPEVRRYPRNSQQETPTIISCPVDETLLAAGDHNGSTYYQHQKFYDAITSDKPVEVTLLDGLKAVVMGLAAQASIETKKAIRLTADGFSFEEI